MLYLLMVGNSLSVLLLRSFGMVICVDSSSFHLTQKSLKKTKRILIIINATSIEEIDNG
nr:MAG TPA: hypothetical protein [Bacteriophage sp.]